jgi:hypothetical protein
MKHPTHAERHYAASDALEPRPLFPSPFFTMENVLSGQRYWIRRRTARLGSEPAEQLVIEVMHGSLCVARMGTCSMLCLSEGNVPAIQTTDDQILRAYLNEESAL